MKILSSILILICSLSAEIGFAQTLTPEQMIEQLKVKPETMPSPSAGTRTRSMRNLTVETNTPIQDQAQPQAVASTQTSTPIQAAAETQAPTQRPSLSLQIQFDFNSSTIRPESQQALTNLANALQSKELLGAKFAVEGHTDARGRAEYNQKLSQYRADSVKQFLISKGIDGARLIAHGKGSTELSNKDEPNAAENRRVKIVNMQ